MLKKILFQGFLILIGACLGVAAIKLAGRSRLDVSRNETASTKFATDHHQLWHCGMHPWVIREEPGDCPICHMKLTPVNSDSSDNGAASGGPRVTIDPVVIQNMGVRTAPVTQGPLTKTVRVLGIIKIAESGLYDVSVKVGGWIDKLYIDQEGEDVIKGQPLFELYSQDLQVAQEELISGSKSEQSLSADTATEVRQQAHSLVQSAKRKLRLWDVAEEDIAAIAKSTTPLKDIPFRSPATGHMIEKMVVQGTAVQPGMKIMRIENHTKMWLDAQVYEDQLPAVKVGQTVLAVVDGIPGITFKGTIGFIYPHFDHATRTITARITLDNPNFHLKPGMYATAEIMTQPIEDSIQVSREAVIDTGTRQIVFVDAGQGHFEPRKVTVGIIGDDDRVQIVSGLSPGEMVVTSGQFLLDVESRTTEAINKLRRSNAPTTEPAREIIVTDAPVTAPAAAPATAPSLVMAAPAPLEHEHPMSAATQPAPVKLSIVHCPMENADWIQIGDKIANPYLGSSMLTCGDVIRKIDLPLNDSDLGPLIEAYLQVANRLDADKLDQAKIKLLLSASEKLPELTFGSLRTSTNKLAADATLGQARTDFKKLSSELIVALEHPSR